MIELLNMDKTYNPRKIEKKWQDCWATTGLYDTDISGSKKPFYNLMMFPYPSGEGLHVGHAYAFSGADIQGRYHMMLGYDVFEPMGWDAFGIHSENYAIKIGEHPAELTKKTTANYRRQLDAIGNMYDWGRSLSTTDVEYYRWTQWLFVQLFKNGLAERKEAEVNWCPSCQTVLADEQVIAGECERCGTQVERKKLKQWFFKITNYKDKLLNNLKDLDWDARVKAAQETWIGKSEGAEISFKVSGQEDITVFTTRPDTLYGATYMVLAPEHHLAHIAAESNPEVAKYVDDALKKTEQQRREEAGKKTGVDTGLTAVNPATEKEIPIWIADYVLVGYGTGAIMAVPAHDDRDKEFAEKFSLEVVEVVDEADKLINSSDFDGQGVEEARKKITEKFGKAKTTYRLRDWLISRQRYWGPPIPIIHCEKCGEVAVPEEDLPVVLPEVENFRPTGTGVSPLASVEEFVNVKCPECDGDAKRETDVSDTFLDSSWYFLRYPSFDNDTNAFDPETTKNWLPVHSYIGGAEHSVLHLLYSRFIAMTLKDMGHIDFDEPFTKFRAHGLLIKDGHKMSKSKGNVINPDEYIENIGADAFRMYLMFLGPYEQGGDFRDEGIAGVVRFLNRVWNMTADVLRNDDVRKDEAVEKLLHKTIKKVTHDIENLHYNTAIAAMMTAINTLEKETGAVSKEMLGQFIQLMAPITPHVAEEIWELLGNKKSIFKSSWPKFDEALAKDDEVTIGIMINGKVRDEITISPDEDEKSVIEKTLKQENVRKWLDGKDPKKTIYVPGKIVTIVV